MSNTEQKWLVIIETGGYDDYRKEYLGCFDKEEDAWNYCNALIDELEKLNVYSDNRGGFLPAVLSGEISYEQRLKYAEDLNLPIHIDYNGVNVFVDCIDANPVFVKKGS